MRTTAAAPRSPRVRPGPTVRLQAPRARRGGGQKSNPVIARVPRCTGIHWALDTLLCHGASRPAARLRRAALAPSVNRSGFAGSALSASGGGAPQFFTESLILAQDERW